MKSNREIVVQTLVGFGRQGLVFDHAMVEEILKKIEGATFSSANFVWVVARNHALDVLRAAKVAANRAVREGQEFLRAEEERRERAEFVVAAGEFELAAAAVIAAADYRNRSPHTTLDAVRIMVFGGGPLEFEVKYPQASYDVQCQRRHRGVDMLLPYASETLRRVLMRAKHRRRA